MRITPVAILLCLSLTGCALGLGRVPVELRDDRTTEGHRPSIDEAVARLPALEARFTRATETRAAPPPRALVTHYGLALEAAGELGRAAALIAEYPPPPADGQEPAPPDAYWLALTASVHHRLYQGDKARPAATAAAEVFAAQGDTYGEAWARVILGQIALDAGEGDVARAEFVRALAQAEAKGDGPLRLEATGGLGRALVMTGDVSEGMAVAQRAVEDAKRAPPAVFVRVLWDGAHAALGAFEVERAVHWLEEAWILVGSGAPSPTPGSIGVAVARGRMAAGDLAGARRAAQSAGTEVVTPAEIADLGRLWLALAQANSKAGEAPVHADALVKAGELCLQAGDVECVGGALGQLAAASLSAGHFAEAALYGAEAANAWERAGNPAQAARTWCVVAEGELAQGNRPAALLSYQRARPALVSAEPAEGAEVEARMATIALDLGRAEDARRYAESAMAAPEAEALAQAYALWVLGRIRLEAEEGADAVVALEAAARQAELAGDEALLGAIRVQLVSAAALLGDLTLLVRHGDAALRGADHGDADLFVMAWLISTSHLAAIPQRITPPAEGDANADVDEPDAEANSEAAPAPEVGEAALHWHRELLKWARDVEHGEVETLAIVGIAEVRRRQGRLVEATTLLEVALEGAEALGDERGIGLILTSMARVSADRERLDEAMSLLRRGLPLVEEANPPALLLEARQLYQVLAAEVHDDLL